MKGWIDRLAGLITDQMSPAELATSVFVIAIVGRMIVATDDPGKGLAQYFPQDLGPSALRDVKKNGKRCDKAPEVASSALVFPAGFVDIEDRGGGHIVLDRANHRLAGSGNTLGNLADGAGGDVDAEECCHDFGNAPTADSMRRRQIGDGGVDSRAEVGVGNPFWQRGDGMAAAGTEQGVQAILCFDGDDRGQFNDLMSQRLSRRVKQALRKRLSAMLTVGRENIVDGIHLLGGQQLPFLAFMARLAALAAFT